MIFTFNGTKEKAKLTASPRGAILDLFLEVGPIKHLIATVKDASLKASIRERLGKDGRELRNGISREFFIVTGKKVLFDTTSKELYLTESYKEGVRPNSVQNIILLATEKQTALHINKKDFIATDAKYYSGDDISILTALPIYGLWSGLKYPVDIKVMLKDAISNVFILGFTEVGPDKKYKVNSLVFGKTPSNKVTEGVKTKTFDRSAQKDKKPFNREDRGHRPQSNNGYKYKKDPNDTSGRPSQTYGDKPYRGNDDKKFDGPRKPYDKNRSNSSSYKGQNDRRNSGGSGYQGNKPKQYKSYK